MFKWRTENNVSHNQSKQVSILILLVLYTDARLYSVVLCELYSAKMLFAQILFIIAFAIICFLGFIYIRAYFDPLQKIPGCTLTDPIFGHIGAYIREGCPLLKYIKQDNAQFGPIRIHHLFLGKVRLSIGNQHWIKV